MPNKEASVKGENSPKYENWSREELLEKAKEAGVKNYDHMKRKELINALRGNY